MIKLSECDLHDIGHARWQVDRATDEKPEVCFDYTLVANLLRIIDRLTAAAEACPECKKWENRYAFAKGIYEKELAEMKAALAPNERWGTNLVEHAAYRHGLAEMKERCAQELETAFAECKTLNLLHGAARLRAMKGED